MSHPAFKAIFLLSLMCSAVYKQPHVDALFKPSSSIMLFSSLSFFPLSLSLISSCPCAISHFFCTHLFVVCLLFCLFLSFIIFSPFLFSLGMRMKTKSVLFSLQRVLNISVLHFLSLSFFFVLPSFFIFFSQASLMCPWIRYHSVRMSSQTQMRGHRRTLAHTPLAKTHPHSLVFLY